jgi:hypothetical protein
MASPARTFKISAFAFYPLIATRRRSGNCSKYMISSRIRLEPLLNQTHGKQTAAKFFGVTEKI